MKTINDIARIAGVDKSTVSRALNNSERISKKVREKIKKIAKELNYYPNASAYSLRKKVNRSIAVVFPKMIFPGGEFFQEILRGIDSIIQKQFFTILFTTYSNDDNSFLRIAMENRVDGAIIIGDVYTMDELMKLDSLDLPQFIVNYKIINHVKNLIDIYSDNERGGELVTEHLIKIHNRKKILFLGGGDQYQANRLRFKGFMNVIKKYKKQGGSIKHDVVTGDFASSFRSAQDLIRSMCKEKKFDFDAVFAASDKLAMGVFNALAEQGIRVPEDVSLIGYDNNEVDAFFPVPITSVDQTAYLIGRLSSVELMKKIMKKDAGPTESIAIQPELVIRRSCGCGLKDQ
ncbi:MAG: LacI family transcriptional regulator [Spirochaetes bacterium]|nr:LacI family transcriptional regulator [Spirochaetota bacterium]